jgi:O-antigen/teichoic acid export membrane protein
MTLAATSGLSFVLGQQSDVFLLGLLLSDRTAIGAYNLAASLNFMLASALLIGFEGITQSALAEVTSRDAARLGAAWVALLKLIMLLSLPGLLFGAVHAPKVVALYGAEYGASAMLLQAYLIFSIAGRFLGGGLNTSALNALGRERVPLVIRLITGAANLVLAGVLIAWQGALGAVLATGLAGVCTGLAETAITMRSTGAAYPWGYAAKVTIASLASVAVSYPLTGSGWLDLLAGGLLTGGCLLLTLALLRPLGPEERRLASRVMPRLAPVLRYF